MAALIALSLLPREVGRIYPPNGIDSVIDYNLVEHFDVALKVVREATQEEYVAGILEVTGKNVSAHCPVDGFYYEVQMD